MSLGPFVNLSKRLRRRQSPMAEPSMIVRETAPGTDPALRVSLVIPVFNEAQNLPALFARLAPVMDGIAGGVEAVIIDDGSSDRSPEFLRAVAAADRRVRVLSFNRNYGQHAAVFAGLDVARGRTVITLDGDLQNPPEAIPALLAKVDEGFDVVGGWRQDRKDSFFRRIASRPFNLFMRSVQPGVQFRDYGCMMRAYSRRVVDSVLQCEDRMPYLPVLACQFARRIAEVPIGHHERASGTSKYTLLKLMRLQADLVTDRKSTRLNSS